MSKCDCFHQASPSGCLSISPTGATGFCYGTKECEVCSCGGDETKCNFYPEKRKKALGVMNTAEMWLKAQKDGKAYVSNDAFAVYSKEMGLVEKSSFDDEIDLGGFPSMDDLMTCEWEEMDNVMTIEEAELKYGIKIIR